MKVRPLDRRWLSFYGIPEGEFDAISEKVRERVRRFPGPVPWLYDLVAWLVEWIFPLVLLGKFSRASRLSDTDFERFERRAHAVYRFKIRGAYVLFRLPLWEAVFPDEKPLSEAHPLEKLPPPPREETEFDVVVIGSGAGGAPAAYSLSKAGLRVAVIEAGGRVAAETVPGAFRKYFLNQTFVIPAAGAMVPVMAGVGVGGTTAINSGTALSPRKEFLAEWDRRLGTRFAEGELDSYLDQVKALLNVHVPPKELLAPSAGIFERGMRALGREGVYVLPRNERGCRGSGRCSFGCPTRGKQSTDIALLPAAVEAGLRLFERTRVIGIEEKRDEVRVRVRDARGEERVFRARECVIAAGALGTPRLIRENRLGSRWRRAGRGLRIHPACKVFARMLEAVHGEKGVPQGMGYLAPDLPRLVFEGIFTPRGGAAPIFAVAGRSFQEWMREYDRVASFGMMVIDRSEGAVDWVREWPVIRYRLHRKDMADLMRGSLLLAEAFLAAGAERVLLPFIGEGNEATTVEELRRIDPTSIAPERLNASGFHPQGTAAMGRVVAPDLTLIGSERVHVCDASVFPFSPGVNPQMTIMALSLRLAERLRGRLKVFSNFSRSEQ